MGKFSNDVRAAMKVIEIATRIFKTSPIFGKKERQDDWRLIGLIAAENMDNNLENE